MTDQLRPSSLTVEQARRFARDLLSVVDGAGHNAIEHFAELCAFLDELYGGGGFIRLLEPADRPAVAGLVQRLREAAPTGSPVHADGPAGLTRPETGTGHDAEHDSEQDAVLRLRQPVNSALTLDQGRSTAAELASMGGWEGEIGRVLQGLYGYLDELYGGRGAFTELLNSEDRPQVARLVESLARP